MKAQLGFSLASGFLLPAALLAQGTFVPGGIDSVGLERIVEDTILFPL